MWQDKKAMRKKIILKENDLVRIIKETISDILNEDYPFNYFNSNSSKLNHGDTINVEGPYIDNPGVKPNPTTGDKVGKIIKNNLPWNRYRR